MSLFTNFPAKACVRALSEREMDGPQIEPKRADGVQQEFVLDTTRNGIGSFLKLRSEPQTHTSHSGGGIS
jgi:hypothetical protein